MKATYGGARFPFVLPLSRISLNALPQRISVPVPCTYIIYLDPKLVKREALKPSGLGVYYMSYSLNS